MADITYNRRIGDRREGHRIRGFSPIHKIVPFFSKSDCDNSNSFLCSVDSRNVDLWVRERRAKNMSRLELLHVFIAAYVRTVAHCPAINRFVSGDQIYARHNIQVLININDDDASFASDSSHKVVFEATDNINDVYRKINSVLDENRASSQVNSADEFAQTISGMPRFVTSFALWILRTLDYYDILPSNFLSSSPFHGSITMTDLSSIGVAPATSSLHSFGNIPLSFCIGAHRRAVETDASGSLGERHYLDYSLVFDKRICTTTYQAAAIKYFEHYIQNPHLLEKSPTQVEEDIF